MTESDIRACPHCGGEIKIAAKLCRHCRKEVPEHVPPAPPIAPVAESPAPVVDKPKLLTCEACEGPVSAAAKACPRCGHPIRVCALCGHAVPVTTPACPNCAHPYTEKGSDTTADRPPPPAATNAQQQAALRRKLLLTIGGVVVVVIVIIIIAVASSGKADIVPDCTLNIQGEGSCSFTNKGDDGSICGTLVAACKNGETATSSEICSGEVRTNETKNVPFSFVGYGDLARPYGLSWSKACSFDFIVTGGEK
jgi:hypothetical protein